MSSHHDKTPSPPRLFVRNMQNTPGGYLPFHTTPCCSPPYFLARCGTSTAALTVIGQRYSWGDPDTSLAAIFVAQRLITRITLLYGKRILAFSMKTESKGLRLFPRIFSYDDKHFFDSDPQDPKAGNTIFCFLLLANNTVRTV